MVEKTNYQAGLYLRLSKDDDQGSESVSISSQRAILIDYCNLHQYNVAKIYADDGYSGMNFKRPAFQQMLEDVENGLINMVITKDLSRLGRNYIMTGYYSEIFFASKGVRYIAVGDNYDSLQSNNDLAPFKNILNEMYARDLSQKIRAAKHQQAKHGQFIGSCAPYGYQRTKTGYKRFLVDEEAAEVVRTIFNLAELGMGNIAIAAELQARKIIAPAAYKYQQGETRFFNYPSVADGNPYLWNHGTVNSILNNRVYLGELASLKTETVNYKTKERKRVAYDQQIVTPNAHEAIISLEQFERVKQIRKKRGCIANNRRYNLFRDLLYCECCGHPLTVSKRVFKSGETDIYFCMYHFHHPDVCPQTHRVSHDVLYPYVLQQIQNFARSMKRRKVTAAISEYADIEELTNDLMKKVIERIEISHVNRKSKPGNVIHIYWKLQ